MNPTDDDVFNSNPELAQEQPVEEAVATESEQPAEQLAPEQTPEAGGKPEAADDKGSYNVPSWRLREEAEKRRALDEQLALERQQRAALEAHLRQIEQQRSPADLFEDPAAYRQALEQQQQAMAQQFQSQLRQMGVNQSFEFAALKYGDEFTKNWDAFQQILHGPETPEKAELRAVGQLILSDQNPGAAFMQYFRNKSLMKETEGDLAAYKKKVIEELKKDPKFIEEVVSGQREAAMAGAPGTRRETRLPPSLSGIAGSRQPRDLSDDEIFSTPPARMR